MSKILKSRSLFLILGILIGGGSVVATQALSHDSAKKPLMSEVEPSQSLLKREVVKPDEGLNFNFDHDQFFENAMKQMQAMRQGFFDHERLSTQFDSPQVTQREDDNYKYVEIKADGVDKDRLEVTINGGMIRIDGEVKNETTTDFGRSQSVSSFHQSFNVPYGVNADQAKIEQSENEIIIKFPKSV